MCRQVPAWARTTLQPVLKTAAGPMTRAGLSAAPVMCPAVANVAISLLKKPENKRLS